MSEPITNRPADYKPHKITLIRRLSFLKDTMIDWVYYTPIQWCRNVKRLLYWLPVIWNDRDYDHNSSHATCLLLCAVHYTNIKHALYDVKNAL